VKASLLSILFLTPLIGFTQIQFTNDSWSEILKRSRLENKAIFVDVYAPWCGPCKKMDRTTFQDPELSAYMNKHFINVKWDAEGAKYGQLSAKHRVRAFPTVLFLNFNGIEHKRKVGFQNAESLLKLSKEVSKFLSTDYPSRSKQLLSNPQEEEFANFLTDNLGMDFLSKKVLFDKYMELIADKDKLDMQAYDILIDNMHTPENVGLAITQMPQKDQVSGKADVEFQRKKMFYKSRIKANLKIGAQDCIKTKDLEQLEKYLEWNYEYGKKSNKVTQGRLAQIENDNFRKEYYRKYRLYDDYVLLVENIMARDILSVTPEELSKTDNQAEIIITERELTHGPVSGSNKRLIYKNHSKAYKIAETLTEFSNDYIQFFARNPQRLSEAITFTELALSYMDIPETRLSRARLYKLQNKNDEALSEANLGLKSSMLEWRTKSKLSSLQKSLSK